MFFALKGYNINNPGQGLGQENAKITPSAENAEQSVIHFRAEWQ